MTIRALTAAAAFATILTAVPASAERYVIVGIQPAEKHMIALDLDTIRDVNGYKRAWALLVLGVAPNGKSYYTQELTEFDCTQERIRSIAVKLFDQTGALSGDGSGKYDTGGAWSYPVPNSAGHGQLLLACGKRPEADEIIELSAFEAFKAFRDTWDKDVKK